MHSWLKKKVSADSNQEGSAIKKKKGKRNKLAFIIKKGLVLKKYYLKKI